MKLKSFILALAVIVSYTNAAYFIQWQHVAGGFTIDGTASTPLLPNIGDTALLQLWAVGPNTVIDDPLPGGGTQGDDILIAQTIFTNVDNSVQDRFVRFQNVYNGQNQPWHGNQVFMRVIQGSSALPGSFYFDTPNTFTVNFKDFSAPQPPVSDIVAWTDTIHVPTGVLIPEPGTVALFLMGGVMMMIRHRRKRFLGR